MSKKIVEYIAMAKMCCYVRPEKDITSWTDIDYHYDSLYITLTNPTQTQSLILACSQNTFTNNYFKRLLKEYIAKFSSS
tara:strand:+ start:2522 stop:2758 length:237 start_codon:yes stop_codon:yes gene_type:complete